MKLILYIQKKRLFLTEKMEDPAILNKKYLDFKILSLV